MKKLENPKNLRELAKINDEKAREEICRIVIKEFSKAKREFVATYCGPDKEFRLYKDSEKDHTVEKMFSAAYAWQVALCHLNFNVLRAVDEKYNWHITFPLLEAINNSKPK